MKEKVRKKDKEVTYITLDEQNGLVKKGGELYDQTEWVNASFNANKIFIELDGQHSRFRFYNTFEINRNTGTFFSSSRSHWNDYLWISSDGGGICKKQTPRKF